MTLLFADDLFLEHETGRHPECPDRLRSIWNRLSESDVLLRFEKRSPRPATFEEITRIHDADYVRHVESFATAGGGNLDADTIVSPESYRVALHAAGAVCESVDEILAGPHDKAACLVRPPGHHALVAKAMGFCLFASVSIAAQHAIDAHGLSRVLIIDFDVHHGNGTQDIFYEREEVTFLSVHRYPFWPGSGAVNETGTGAGLGTTFNLPVAFGTGRDEYKSSFRTTLEDAAAKSQPELIILSAGFDAHRDDPIGSLGLESEDFATLTDDVLAVANSCCAGRVISVLEGGYNLAALAECVEIHLDRFASPPQ